MCATIIWLKQNFRVKPTISKNFFTLFTMSYNLNVNAAINRAYSLTDYNIHNDIHKQYEFRQQTILDDESLTKDEKFDAIRMLNKIYDKGKITINEGTKRVCENCNQECLATLYCEYCVRNYLKENFSNWTSGNNDINTRMSNKNTWTT